MNVIIVTACPSGMATTFLAARRLEQAARRRGWNPIIDMRSRIEPEITLSEAQLAEAELVLIAASPLASVALDDFLGKRVHLAPIEDALPDPQAFLELAHYLDAGAALFMVKVEGSGEAVSGKRTVRRQQEALARVAAVMMQTYRQSDLVGRYADHEFVLLALDSADPSQATLSERFRQSIGQLEDTSGESLGLTIRVGQATMAPGTQTDLPLLMARSELELSTVFPAPNQGA